MTEPNDNVYPFAETHTSFDGEGNQTVSSAFSYHGLTKREYFAAMAMQGMLANYGLGADKCHIDDIVLNGSAITDWAVVFADDLIKKLNSI